MVGCDKFYSNVLLIVCASSVSGGDKHWDSSGTGSGKAKRNNAGTGHLETPSAWVYSHHLVLVAPKCEKGFSSSDLRPNSKLSNAKIITVNNDGNDDKLDGRFYLFPFKENSWGDRETSFM